MHWRKLQQGKAGRGSAGPGQAVRGKDKQGEVDSKHPAISVVGWNGGNSNRARLGPAWRGMAGRGWALQGKARQSFNNEVYMYGTGKIVGYTAGSGQENCETDRVERHNVRQVRGRQQDATVMGSENLPDTGNKYPFPPDKQHRFVLVCP